MKYTKLLIIIAIVGLFVVFYKLGFNKYLSLEALQANKEALNTFYHEHQLVFTGVFMLIYIISAAISLPGATVLTLTGGFIFGPLLGSGIVIVSATIGASLAFLVARFILRNTLEKKYAHNLKKFNDGITKNAWSYLLFLRLVPLFPFFLINIVMGLTRVPLRVFTLVSLVGMYPGTFVYALAGGQLAVIHSVKDIASPRLIGAFTLLGCFALIPGIYKRFKGVKK